MFCLESSENQKHCPYGDSVVNPLQGGYWQNRPNAPSLTVGPPRIPPGSILFGSLPAGATTAAARGVPGERRPLWRRQRGLCPGRWACGGRPASVGRFLGRPGGIGSQCRSWCPWTRSPWGPWAGWGETLHWLQGSRTIHKNVRDSWRQVFLWEGLDTDESTSETGGWQDWVSNAPPPAVGCLTS